MASVRGTRLNAGDRSVLYVLLATATALGFVLGTRRAFGAGGYGTVAGWRVPTFRNSGEALVSRVLLSHFRRWGENPPYHAPTFVLTHHPRPPQEMQGGTIFHFVTDGIRAALDHARSAAGDTDIRLLGGADTIPQYLEACLVDEMHIAVSPRLLGAGESLFAGLDLPRLGYRIVRCTPGEKAVYYLIARGQSLAE